jgi:hypothetical protein
MIFGAGYGDDVADAIVLDYAPAQRSSTFST